MSPVLPTNGYKLEVPTTPSLGSTNLLKQLRELRSNVFTRLPVSYTGILKDVSQEPDGEAQGEVPNKGVSVPPGLVPCMGHVLVSLHGSLTSPACSRLRDRRLVGDSAPVLLSVLTLAGGLAFLSG